MSVPSLNNSRNYVDAYCVLTSSHGGTLANCYDKNTATQIVTTGANNDATIWDFYVEFYEDSVSQSRTIDTIYIQNHNFKQWDIRYWDGASWVICAGEHPSSDVDSFVRFTPIKTTKIWLACDQTKTPNAEKRLGELFVGTLSYAEPRFYTRNYIESTAVISSSHGGTVTNIYDRSADKQLVTIGANNDATIWNLYVDFYSSGIAQNRKIDTVVLQNHNFYQWDLRYWNGSAWVICAGEHPSSSANAYIYFTPVTTQKLWLAVDITKTANAEKSLGEFIVCALSYDVNQDMSSYDTKWREKTKEVVLGDGSIHRVVTRSVSGRNGRYEAKCQWSNLPKDKRDYLKAIKEAGTPFLWQPESLTNPQDVFYTHWTNSWDDKYMSNYKGAGYEVVMDLKEV